MAPKVGPSQNLPTTDPYWREQRLIDTNGADLPPEEEKINIQQGQEINKLFKSLSQPVQKGDMKAARARVDSLQKQFESLSPDNKKYMYNMLQTKNVNSEEFHYRLSTASRDKLLKTLNPDHKEDHIKKYTIADAREKAQKEFELNMQGTTKQKELEKVMEEQNKMNKEIIQNTIR
jgi:hypothetical protein